MAENSKYLFGLVPVKLVPTEEPIAGFTHEVEVPGQQLAKEKLEEGMCHTLRIERGWWRALPQEESTLSMLHWNNNPLRTALNIDFCISPLFDQYPNVITAFQAQITIETSQEILTTDPLKIES